VAFDQRLLEQIRRANEGAASTLAQLERSNNWTPLGRFLLIFLVAAIGVAVGMIGVWLSWPWLSLLGEIVMAICVVLLFGAVTVGVIWDVFVWFRQLLKRRR
jgi:DUF3040 family protein